MKTTSTWTMLVVLAVAVGGMAGCDSAPKGSPLMELMEGTQMEWEQKAAALQVAPDCDTALASFKQMLKTGMLVRLEEQRKWYLEYAAGGGLKGEYAEDAAAPSESLGSGEQNSGPSDSAEEYSDTNVQVVGVDEADLVKTDGNLMYVLSEMNLVVLDAWPADQMHELGRVKLRKPGSGFFRFEDRLVVLAYGNRSDFEPAVEEEDKYEDYYYYRWEPMTLVTIVDIATPDNPVIIDETLFEGSLLDSRRVESKMYLVQQDWGGIWNQELRYWPDELNWEASEAEINEAFSELAMENLAFIDSLTLEQVLPTYYKFGNDGYINESSGQAMTSCTSLYYPSVFSGTGLMTAVTVDIDGLSPVHGSSVLGDWGTLYVSLNALYGAASNWSWWWWWEDGEQPEIQTQIHKFAFNNDTGNAEYVASGSVVGYVLNQFSLDERDGYLRVATTVPDWGWWNDDSNDSESFVTVLRQEGGLLVEEGKVGGLGKGETIQSVRFIGPQGYVVTFRQTDPLYVIDLSEPSAPVVAGELKIPGFSSYIHPMDDTHLLTIGRDGDEEGSTFGVSFQIFDVSDPAKPTQVAKTTLGEDDGWNSYTWSEAMWDHHAFVYFASQKMLAVPVSGWNWDDEAGSSYSSSLELLHVDLESGITPFATLSHLDLMGELPGLGSTEEYCWYDLSWILNERVQIKRGVFMDNFIYSISRAGVKVHDLEDMAAGAIQSTILTDNADLPEYLEQYYGYCWY